jgi:3-oxoacyl-[acyl-carrier-protein] synthase-3
VSAIYVSRFASALGSVRQSVEQAETAGLLFSPAAALRDAGFDCHHVCGADESAYSLAVKAVAASGIEPATIDAIVYSTCLPVSGNLGRTAEFEQSGDVKHLMHFPASELQAELGMQRAFIIGLNQQACTGMLGALRIARNLLHAEADLANVLCVTADRFPPGARYEQAFNLISDGAAACRVSRDRQGLELLDVHHITNGAMADASDEETAASYFNYCCRRAAEHEPHGLEDPQETARRHGGTGLVPVDRRLRPRDQRRQRHQPATPVRGSTARARRQDPHLHGRLRQ